jgi:hypothetical protein
MYMIKMRGLEVTLVLLGISMVWGAYDENLARYKIFPLAGAAYGDHPELCVKDNFKNSSVSLEKMPLFGRKLLWQK